LGGFERHIDYDHNLWWYVYYLVHIIEKDETEFNGVESYVKERYNSGYTDWIPRARAMCLDSEEGGDAEVNEISQMQDQI
jgi:hypothetical protein